ASDPVPNAARRTKDRDIALAVAVHVAGERDVFADAEFDDDKAGIVAFLHVPNAGRLAENRQVVSPVAVKIAAHGRVGSEAELHRGYAAVGAALDIPDAASADVFENGGIGFAVAVVIGGDGNVQRAAEALRRKALAVLRIPNA